MACAAATSDVYSMYMQTAIYFLCCIQTLDLYALLWPELTLVRDDVARQ